MAKQRLDVYLAEQGLVKSRSEAQAIIMAGEVYINNQKASKAGEHRGAESGKKICQPWRT